jgi:hypothetical protein
VKIPRVHGPESVSANRVPPHGPRGPGGGSGLH